jgi:hypothetical protein
MADAIGALERARGNRERDWENFARTAFSFGSQTSTGWGELAYADPIIFDLTFVEQPMMSYGFYVDPAVDLVPTRYPRCSGFVYRWYQDAKGMYVGAWVGVTVETREASIVPATGVVDPGYAITHYYTFSGLGYKSLLSRAGQLDA